MTKHMKRKSAHDGMRRNAKNKIVFECNVCDKAYSSQDKLRKHRYYAKHVRSESMSESVAADENIYSSDGCIRNEISREKERDILNSILCSFIDMQEAVKRAYQTAQ